VDSWRGVPPSAQLSLKMNAMKPSGKHTSVASVAGRHRRSAASVGLLAHGGGWARGAAARCGACARALIGAMPGTLVGCSDSPPERGCAAGGRYRRCRAGLWLALRLRLPHWSLRDRPRRRVSAVAVHRPLSWLFRHRLRGGLEICPEEIWTSEKVLPPLY